MKKLQPNVQEALSRPIDYWEAKRVSDCSASVSDVHVKLIVPSGKACEDQVSEETVSNEASAFHNVADDAQLKLLDDIKALKKALSEMGESNSSDIADLRSAHLQFKTRMNEKVDALERGTVIAVERLVGEEDNGADSTGNC